VIIEPRDPMLEALARQPLPQRLFLWHMRKWLEARIGTLPKSQKKSRPLHGQHVFRFLLPVLCLCIATSFAWPQRGPLWNAPLRFQESDGLHRSPEIGQKLPTDPPAEQIASLRGEIAELRNRMFEAEERIGKLEHPGLTDQPASQAGTMRARGAVAAQKQQSEK